MDVSENSGFSPQIIHFNRVFHYKTSILGYPYCWKHPYGLVFFVFSPKKISHLRRAFRRAEQELCRLGLPAEELALRTVEGFGGG